MIEERNTTKPASIALNQMLKEMKQALTDEIDKLSKFKPIKHSAVDGKLLSEGNGQYIYQFTLTEPWEPQDDGQLSIASESTKGITCTVITSVGTIITIAAESPLPPQALRQIDLYDDSTELLKRLREALDQVDEGQAKLGSKCFGLLESAKKSYPGEITCGPFQLRPNQMQATRLALGGEVTFIVGPPGTGKTSTLATIALKHLQAGHTVLIAAHTNIAIDNAIMKLCDLCKAAKNDDLLADGQVVRYGAVQKEELKKNDNYKEVYLPKIAQRLGSDLHTQHERLKAELANLDAQMNALQQKEHIEEERGQAEHLRTQIAILQKELDPLEKAEAQHILSFQQQQRQQQAALAKLGDAEIYWSRDLARTEALIMEQERALAREQQNKNTTLAQLVEARAMNNIKRFLKGIKLESLELKVAAAAQSVEEIEHSLQVLKKHRSEVHQQLRGYKQQRQTIEAALNEIQSALNTPSGEARRISILREQLQAHKQRLTELETLLKQKALRYQQDYNDLIAKRSQIEAQNADVDQQLRDLEKNIVEKARVIGTTLTKTYMNQTMASKRFDAVILDEVSMASLPLVYVAVSRADSSVTLIGDPQQLAPIADAETPMAEKWLKTDLFSLREISLEAARSGREHSAMLDVQSRMHPAISAIANKYVYDGALEDDFNETMCRKLAPLPESPLVLCDTHDASPTATRPPNGKSRKNYYHALCSIALARQILASAPEMKQRTERSIGIVTPYRPQARLLQSLLKDEGLQNWVQAGTVHRFQGLEFDVVIFDTVESPGLPISQFISGSRGSNSMRLINVAVTRPRQKLFIVANLQYLRSMSRQGMLPSQATFYLTIEEAARAAILPSLDIAGTSFSTFIEKMRELAPGSDHLQAALAGTLLSHTPPEVYRYIVKDDVLVFRHAEASNTAKQDEGEIKHFAEKTVYAAAEQDIRNARKSICIASPYLAEGRLNTILPLLVAQKNKGVDIEIFTRPREESDDWDIKAAEKVQSAGIKPIFKSKMHEKAVIIDEKVLYHGSLNSLSHRDTTESILRITIPGIIKDVNDSIRSNRSAKPLVNIDDATFEKLDKIEIPLDKLSTTTKCTCGKPLEPRFDRKDKVSVYFWCPSHSGPQKLSFESLRPVHLESIAELQTQNCRKCGSPTFFDIDNTKDKPQRVLLICSAGCGEMQRIVFTF
jgi:hypothetical protein